MAIALRRTIIKRIKLNGGTDAEHRKRKTEGLKPEHRDCSGWAGSRLMPFNNPSAKMGENPVKSFKVLRQRGRHSSWFGKLTINLVMVRLAHHFQTQIY